MKRAKAEQMFRMQDTYIFYTCLVLVLAIAALGLAIDATAGR
jgi:hypothetical protein